ncbi:hypothetical protein C8J57DRAFT_1503320 [Mycena rebaudengoi]|nr:hypothetical protein C8J57DRAFT_1503320 [Mycena rebaudengoi]
MHRFVLLPPSSTPSSSSSSSLLLPPPPPPPPSALRLSFFAFFRVFWEGLWRMTPPAEQADECEGGCLRGLVSSHAPNGVRFAPCWFPCTTLWGLAPEYRAWAAALAAMVCATVMDESRSACMPCDVKGALEEPSGAMETRQNALLLLPTTSTVVPSNAVDGEVPNSWYIRVPSMALQALAKSKIVPTQCDYLHQDDLHFYRFLPHASDRSPDCSTDRRFPVPTPSQCSVFCPAQVQMFASLMQIYSGPRD